MARIILGIYIFLDNFEVACNTDGIFKSSSQSTFTKFEDLAKGQLLTSKQLSVQWILGYAKIEENELTNQKAKKYTKLLLITRLSLHQSMSNTKRIIKKMKNIKWQLGLQKRIFFRAAQIYIKFSLKLTSSLKFFIKLRSKKEF